MFPRGKAKQTANTEFMEYVLKLITINNKKIKFRSLGKNRNTHSFNTKNDSAELEI